MSRIEIGSGSLLHIFAMRSRLEFYGEGDGDVKAWDVRGFIWNIWGSKYLIREEKARVERRYRMN